MPDGHTLVVRPEGTKAQLAAQVRELLALRGEMELKDWVKLLGVPYRTYRRYEKGERLAPEPLMRYARTLRGRAGKKRA